MFSSRFLAQIVLNACPKFYKNYENMRTYPVLFFYKTKSWRKTATRMIEENSDRKTVCLLENFTQ